MLHPDLQKLLDFSLESGEVTEKHRQILHKKAVLLSQDLDELDMIVDGEIKRLRKIQESQEQNKYDCPNCGSSIPGSAIKCRFCGFEISKTSVTGKDFLDRLNRQLDEVNKRQSAAELAKKWHQDSRLFGNSAAQQKASIISTFSMPNDKENLLEFFYFCDSNYDSHKRKISFGYDLYAEADKILRPAWGGKAKLAYNKLKRFENDDNEISELIENYKKKYYQDPSTFKAVSINTDQNNGKAVLMGLNLGGVILFFILLLACFPICWLPFVIPSFKAG